ncbi:MAG: 16S rRNA (guanine(527)-N(7))-methyltransferase RsmG [Bacteroidales bacterium]|nr:16S rRNA (guanine(527)-N(7))-methyltransferase RsmG [Bacteroidales bacterium]
MEQILLQHFPDLSENQINQFKTLASIFPEWNNKVNCVSRKDIDNLFTNHILHSLSIAKKFEFNKKHCVADIGTGGGFPGIPLAIMFPHTQFDLVDSIGKKIMVVKEIAKDLKLENVNGINARAESLPEKYDFVVSRAVTSFYDFFMLVRNIILKKTEHNSQGIIYLKGGDFENELKSFNNFQIYDIQEFFDYEYFETKKIIYLPVNKKK